MYRFSRPKPSPWPRLLLIGAVVVVIVLAALALWGLPQVVGMSPQGSSVSARAPLALTFNTEMDALSVESHLQLDPLVTGTFSWSERTPTFIPAAEWPLGRIRVFLEAGASSTTGLPLLFDSNWEFSVSAPGV